MRRPVGIMDFKLFQSQLIHEGGVFFFFFASGKESASSAVHSFDWQLFSYGGSSHIVGQDCASLGCYSDICDPHSNVWRGKGGDLTHDETTIITRAHDLTLKTAKDAMTPISKAFSLNLDATLNLDTLNAIMTMGHSRVPVYAGDPKNIIGLILVKNLLVLDPEGDYVVGPSAAAQNMKAGLESHDFRTALGKNDEGQHRQKKSPPPTPAFKKRHRGCSYCILDIENSPIPQFPSIEEVVGVITMEDVIEELLQEEMSDETDMYINIHNRQG
ncbi:hypothetical protein GH714_006001 [Hevea brasiliensis]|uniref:CBS domain-containing protein n=1 Tax=Hevea brasiliensis TaxID=3981 RepID=A0A6A6LHC2_HEVBR|nr:hypothetical protein GH714_006001 [Hevea brasiliensis]